MARTFVSKPPSSTRQKLNAIVLAAKKHAKDPRPPPHHLDSDSPVLQLPGELSDAGRIWWNKYIGKTFLEWKKNRGNKFGAKGRLRRIFRKEWWPEHFPDVEVLKEDKIWYFDKTNIGTQIYSYVNNNSVRGSSGRQPAKPTAIKKRAYGHDDWRRDNPDIFKAAVEAWTNEHDGETPDVGKARALSSKVFKRLPEDEQEKWREVARERLASLQSAAKIVDPNDRADYIADFKKSLNTLVEEGAAIGGIQVCALILYEKPDGKLKIERHISKNLQGFGKTQAFGNSMLAMQKWVEETGGKPVEGGPPSPCVYPIYSKNNFPGIPNYVGWKLEPWQGLMRGYTSSVLRFQGGVTRVAWTEISEDPEKFINPSRLPDGLLAEFGDPGNLRMAIVSSIVDYFLCCHTGKVPPEKTFQFQLVFAGSTPIHPDDSQEKRRDQVEHGGRLGWMLRFEKTVTYCHHPNGMDYLKGAHDYARFVLNGLEPARAVCAAPARWLGLPPAGPGIFDRAFSDTEYERYSSLASLLPESSGSRITAILDATNNHQRLIPASNSKGVYALDRAPPTAIPPRPNSSQPSQSMWMPVCYYQSRRVAPVEGTVDYFKGWQQDLIDSKTIYHGPSGSMYGGETGVVCVVRPLMDLVLNFAAARRDFQPPEDVPEGYDLTRLPINEWDRLLGWVDRWTKEIKASTQILSASFEERREGLENIVREQAIASGSEESPTFVPIPEPEPLTGPPKKQTSGKGKSKSQRYARKEDEDEDVDEDFADEDEGSRGGDDIDFNELDKTSQDDEDDNDGLAQWTGDDSGLGLPEMETGTGDGTRANDPTEMPDEDEDEQYDRLDLRFKYGFTGDNTYVDDDTGPRDTLLASHLSSLSWSPTAGVFCSFTELPPYQPTPFHSPHALVKQIRGLELECKQAVANFEAYVEARPSCSPAIIQAALTRSRDFPVPLQPLYRLLFTRQAVWKNAGRLALRVRGHAERMALIMREGVQLHLNAEQVIEHGLFPDPKLKLLDVAKAVVDSKKQLVVLRWTYNELRAFHVLATEQYNTHKANWMDVPTDRATLGQIVRAMLDWEQKMAALAVTLQSKREVSWAKYTSEPFPEQHQYSGMGYYFGCATSDENPMSLQVGNTLLLTLPSPTPPSPTPPPATSPPATPPPATPPRPKKAPEVTANKRKGGPAAADPDNGHRRTSARISAANTAQIEPELPRTRSGARNSNATAGSGTTSARTTATNSKPKQQSRPQPKPKANSKPMPKPPAPKHTARTKRAK